MIFKFLRLLTYLTTPFSLAIIIFNLVLPAKIIQKYNGNTNGVIENQLVDNELYSLSIASLVLSILLFIFFPFRMMILLSSIFVVVLSCMSIAQAHKYNVTNYQLYAVSITTIVSMIIIL